MKASTVFAALVVLVAACAAPVGESKQRPSPPDHCDRVFVVDQAFTEEENIGLERAVARWNAIATEQFCLRPAEDGEIATNTQHGVYRIEYKSSYWETLSKQFGGANVLGVHYPSTDQIGIVGGMADNELIALHEFGHAHGLAHTEAPSIMHASIGTASDFTPIDMAECRRVGACQKEYKDGGE